VYFQCDEAQADEWMRSFLSVATASGIHLPAASVAPHQIIMLAILVAIALRLAGRSSCT